MTNPEFSNEFDVLFNNITSNQAPGLDEYEKSVFLTNAQDDVVRAYFNPRENKPQQGFDDSRKRQMDFSALMKTKVLKELQTEYKFDGRSISYRIPEDLLLFVNEACNDSKSRYVVIPISYDEYDRLMLKPYQYPIKKGIWRLIVDAYVPSISSVDIVDGDMSGTLSIENNTNREVTFTIHTVSDVEDETDSSGHTISKKGVGKAPVLIETGGKVDINCVLSTVAGSSVDYWNRFLIGTRHPWSEDLHKYVGNLDGTGNSIFPNVAPSLLDRVSVTASPMTPCIELIGRFDKKSLIYTLRYVRRPRPIILTSDLEGLSIRGVSTESSCELDQSLHPEILQRAVELAKAAYIGDLQSQIALGQSSKTDIGMIAQSR